MLTPTNKIKAVFQSALDKATLAERAAFLDDACTKDPVLRQRVDALLQVHDHPDRLLDLPAAENFSGETDEAPRPDDSLTFLNPSQKPGSLGRLDHYEVLEVVGRGGMGMVFRAFDTKLQRVIAIKALVPQLAMNSAARQRFDREARAAAAVMHDNVIAIHAVEETGPVPYLVMQFIEGCSLQEKLERSGPLPLKETLRIGLHIAEGLEAAHRQGLIHRDVKPANILLENGVERVKLTDFGLARASDDASLTQSGVVAGTPMYMSPEQAHGEYVDCRSDLFSLGSVLYAMCTGRPPFRAPTSMGVLKRVCEEMPRPVWEINPEMPSWLGDLLMRLHAKTPADRFASAREVADLLTRRLAMLQHSPTTPPGKSDVLPSAGEDERKESRSTAKTSTAAPPTRSRRPWVLAAAVLLVLFAGLGLSETTGVTNVRGTVIRLFSGEGTLIVELDDPGVSVSLDGEELVIQGGGVREIRLKPGQYQVRATRDDKVIRQELVTITKNGRQAVRISQEPAPAKAATDDAAAWERIVATLPADVQVTTVAARLKELNPGFDGKVTQKIEDGVVTELTFSADHVTNLKPVRALSKLRVLKCSGSYPSKGRLDDLSPLKGMPLAHLDCADTQVPDLSPLKGMSLTSLFCDRTAVSDLSPLKGMSLTEFRCTGSRVSDLSPLRGMRLHTLFAEVLPLLSDLSPLQGMPLIVLGLYRTRVSDLSPLKGMPLESLNLTGVPVSDLAPLKDMTTLKTLYLKEVPVADLSMLKGLPLEFLDIRVTRVSDLAPLEGMPLKQLSLDFRAKRDAELLRSLKGLERINDMPAAEFWKEQQKTKSP